MESTLDSSGDWGNMKYVGYDTRQSQATQYLFDKSTIKTISSKITELLQGVEKNGKQIIVTDNIITNVISSLLAKNNIGNIGDIYSRYTIARQEPDCGVSSIIDRTIETIVSYIKNQYGMIENNESLSIWNSILGGQNELGLMPHSKIKTPRTSTATDGFPYELLN